MGASGLGGGGKRNVNVELNLVPFIDLLSTLICFLLITAVWNQISALSTNAASTTTSDQPAAPDPNHVDLSVSLLTDHLLATEGTNNTRIAHINGEPNFAQLAKVLEFWKSKYPTRQDMIVHSDSQAPYKHLIKLMDTLVEMRFEDVGVNTN